MPSNAKRVVTKKAPKNRSASPGKRGASVVKSTVREKRKKAERRAAFEDKHQDDPNWQTKAQTRRRVSGSIDLPLDDDDAPPLTVPEELEQALARQQRAAAWLQNMGGHNKMLLGRVHAMVVQLEGAISTHRAEEGGVRMEEDMGIGDLALTARDAQNSLKTQPNTCALGVRDAGEEPLERVGPTNRAKDHAAAAASDQGSYLSKRERTVPVMSALMRAPGEVQLQADWRAGLFKTQDLVSQVAKLAATAIVDQSVPKALRLLGLSPGYFVKTIGTTNVGEFVVEGDQIISCPWGFEEITRAIEEDKSADITIVFQSPDQPPDVIEHTFPPTMIEENGQLRLLEGADSARAELLSHLQDRPQFLDAGMRLARSKLSSSASLITQEEFARMNKLVWSSLEQHAATAELREQQLSQEQEDLELMNAEAEYVALLTAKSAAITARVTARDEAVWSEIHELEIRVAELEAEHAALKEQLVAAEREKAQNRSAAESLENAWESMQVLDLSTQLRMDKRDFAKAGRTITNMKAAGYQNDEINIVCRALYVDQSHNYMFLAFSVFDVSGEGDLDATEFKETMKMLGAGEGITEEEINDLFQQADADGSGFLEFAEFAMLMRSINPKEENFDQEPKDSWFHF